MLTVLLARLTLPPLSAICFVVSLGVFPVVVLFFPAPTMAMAWLVCGGGCMLAGSSAAALYCAPAHSFGCGGVWLELFLVLCYRFACPVPTMVVVCYGSALFGVEQVTSAGVVVLGLRTLSCCRRCLVGVLSLLDVVVGCFVALVLATAVSLLGCCCCLGYAGVVACAAVDHPSLLGSRIPASQS